MMISLDFDTSVGLRLVYSMLDGLPIFDTDNFLVIFLVMILVAFLVVVFAVIGRRQRDSRTDAKQQCCK